MNKTLSKNVSLREKATGLFAVLVGMSLLLFQPSVALAAHDSEPPTASITSPANGATVAGSLMVDVSASDDAKVTKVRLLVDGELKKLDETSPYKFYLNTRLLSEGSHSLVARAYDAAGNTGNSSVVMITVDNNESVPPTVSITSPMNGATVSGTLMINTFAEDNVRVSKVRLFVDGKFRRVDRSAPYRFFINTKFLSNGSHVLRVRAYDTAGNISEPSTITITVEN